MRTMTIILVVGAILTASGAALADDTARVRQLEQKVGVMEKTRMSNNAQIASALSQFGALQDEFGSLKGEIQTNKHLINSQYQDIGKRITDLDHRIQSIEDRMQIFSTQLSKALGKVSPEAAAEGDLYQKGLDQVTAARYLEAAASFESFVRKYPKSKFAESARFWIAECFYSMRDYQRAIKEYQKFIEQYSRSPKVPEAVVKQGHSFYELGMMDEAKAFYDQVVAKYPSSSAASEARERIARIESKQSQASNQGKTSPGSYPTQTIQQQREKEKTQGF